MTTPPETRPSLLIRLRNPADENAWFEFAEIYRPVITRLAVRKGLQAADAENVAQNVLASIARVIEKHNHDPRRAKFRTWLNRIAHNAILNALTRIKPDRGSGNTEIQSLLNHVETKDAGGDSELLRLERRRELFRRASRIVVDEFQPATWQAFWKTAVEGQPVAVVSDELGKKPGAIYAARCRIMRRIQEVVADYESQFE